MAENSKHSENQDWGAQREENEALIEKHHRVKKNVILMTKFSELCFLFNWTVD